MPENIHLVEKDPYDIFDRTFKRVLTLSKRTVIKFINGVFNKTYSDDSELTYNWTEFVDNDMKKILADTIITINGTDSFHIEAQMYKNEKIVLRMIDYGYHQALRTWESIPLPEDGTDIIRLKFPSQLVINLDEDNAPDTYCVKLDFGDQEIINYKIPVLSFQNIDLETIKKRHMIILLPFKLLKLRKKIEKSRSKENISELWRLSENDIMSTIRASFDAGEIDTQDKDALEIATKRLFKHLYQKYDELKEMIEMYDHSLDLISDKYYDALDVIKEKDAVIAEKDAVIAGKDAALSEKDAEIARLKAELAASHS